MSAALAKNYGDRVTGYLTQTGRRDLTARQARRVAAKRNRAARAGVISGVRTLTPRQARWVGITAARAARRASR